jgi:hypothetical protein
MSTSNRGIEKRSSEIDTEANVRRVSQSAEILLRRVFRILRGCGISEVQLREQAAKALNEVERISDTQAGRVTARQAVLCSDVVLKWRRDCRFLDGDGMPALLPMSGTEASFEALVSAGASGADATAVLATMAELGVVRIADGNKIELTSESVVACSGKEGTAIASECILEHICGFLGSVEFNVFDKPSRAKGRFERACYASVPRELVPVLQRLVSTRGQDFIDAIDEWLARRSGRSDDNSDTMLVGAGAYLFVRENLA